MTVATEARPATSTWANRLVRPVGILAIVAGLVMIIAGGVVWGVVSSQLQDQKITVSEDAAAFGGQTVAGPFTALAQADIINTHAEKLSGGKTYAELEQDDPLRPMVMNASFLRASLFTSVVSFGVAAFAMGAGLIVALLGWAVWMVAPKRRGASPAVAE
ncbi:hypothetical protein [Leifsonia aquatica]|uniref:hypothetical protein n=1 Tax=Leifsonia aquatica TaxID=144185 RepID=UPI0004A7FA41|nr:hypothetical protein [Leifsonia aquatica]